MSSKININRLITGGVIGGIAMLAVGVFIHDILLHDTYLELAEEGIIRSEENIKGVLFHHMSVIIAGVPLSFLYVLVREKAGPGPGTAVRVGVLAWMICLPGIIALYAIYNLGTFIPLATGGGALVSVVTGAVIAGSIYKD